ncbi:MAG: archaeosortase/exosortase family protein [Hydrotalea sp.]|nr:archaeosortase/exosortase family protein [Hydrotalea sp.]
MLTSIYHQIKEGLGEMPRTVKIFLLKAFILFIVWEGIYLGFLQKDRIIDGPLTNVTAQLTAKSLEVFYPKSHFYTLQDIKKSYSDGWFEHEKSVVWKDQQRLIGIADGCNGLNLFMLFLGFILAYPSSIRLKLGFGFLGLIFIFAINILRCTGLGMVQIHYPHFTIYAHHYIFNLLTYAVVFFLWIKFSKWAS